MPTEKLLPTTRKLAGGTRNNQRLSSFPQAAKTITKSNRHGMIPRATIPAEKSAHAMHTSIAATIRTKNMARVV